MSAAMTIAPSAPLAGYTVSVSGTGFSQYKTRLKLDGTVVATICRPTAGAFTTPVTVGAAGTETLTAEQNVAGVWGSAVATLSITVAAAPTDPAGGTNFYDVPASLIAAIPGGSPSYSGSGSLASFLAGLAAGQYGVLDFNGYVTENIDVVLASGVTVIPASGKTPGLDGSLRLRGGTGIRFYGLANKWTAADSSGHMVKLDGGSIEYGYAQVHDAACYTLLRPGQTLHDWRIHHVYVHDNSGPHGTANQDHGIYADPPGNSNGLIDHCLIKTMPHGRNIKIGGPSSGFSPISGITIRKCSLQDGQGPSNSQVSNGATGITYDHCLFSRSGSSTNLTGSSSTSAGLGSTYANCKGDSTVGPNNAYLTDAGGNTDNVALATVENYVTQGGLGYGHLAT